MKELKSHVFMDVKGEFHEFDGKELRTLDVTQDNKNQIKRKVGQKIRK